MKVRLLGLDLDGTLLEPDGTIHSDVIHLVEKISNAGITVALASGRPQNDIEAIMSDNGIADRSWPAFYIANERDLYWRQASGFEPESEWNDTLREAEVRHLEKVREVVESWRANQPDAGAFVSYDDPETEQQRGFIALHGPEDERMRECQSELTPRLQRAELPMVAVRNRRIVVFRHEDICKGKTLLHGVSKLDIAPGEVLAIGDTDNDRGMLDGRYSFHAACPANADPEIQAYVRAVKGHVATEPHGRGVLEILQEVGLARD